MKSYTDIEQSKKLAEILPIKSADMYWLNWHIDLTDSKYEVFVINKSNKYIDFFNSYAVAIDNNEIIPCWSLAALLDVIPKHTKDFNVLRIDINKKDFSIWYDEVGYGVNNELPDITMESAVDACYEFILKLHELKML